MPQYAPLPPIELDPRNESELVAAAAQRVYESSGATINDFSSGSPVMALLEGQAFAQAELLAFANSFPESVLVEWIGPFLGAQRRTGAGAVVQILFTITPRNQEFVIFPGFELATDTNLTNGQSVSFVTTERLVIPPNSSTGLAQAVAVLRGTFTNVPANSITRTVTSLADVVSVTNPEASAGGQDPELLSEVKERFFTLIRRRNPVSAEDWADFFSDAIGAGAAVNVLPRRSEKGVYRYDSNYVDSAPAVSFYVLNPDGTPITEAQRYGLQNLLRFALPTEFTGVVYPMEVDNVDIDLVLSYDPNKPYAANLADFTRTVRGDLFGIMTPNAVFPSNYDPNVSDVEGALATALPLTLGLSTQYIDPDILSLRAYHVPKNISGASFTVSNLYEFKTGDTLKAGDIAVDNSDPVPAYFSVLESFTPVTNDKSYQANIGNLSFTLIQELTTTTYKTGDVVTIPVGSDPPLYVVRADFTNQGLRTPEELVADGLLTSAKAFTPYALGTQIDAFDSNGLYDPDIIAFSRDDIANEVYEPRTPASAPLNKRPGYPVWVAKQNFVVEQNLTDLGTAQTAGYIGTAPIEIEPILPGYSYSEGQYISTPDPETLLTGTLSPNQCYISKYLGASIVYAKVLIPFYFDKPEGQPYKVAIDELVAAGIIEIVQVIDYIDCAGRPLFADRSFRYTARFALGEYLRFRPEGGFDAAQLEDCYLLASSCGEVTPACKRLLEANLPLPRYFQALVDFTPTTADVQQLLADGVIAEVQPSIFRYDYTIGLVNANTLITPATITSLLITSGQITGPSELIPGQTLLIIGAAGENLGSYFWSGQIWGVETAGIPTFRDMFRFAPKDSTTVRNGTSLRQYEATQHVTPVLDLEPYYDSGVFISSERPANIPYYDALYRYEDTIISYNGEAPSFYRVVRSFNAPTTVTSWAGESINTPRIEEVFGNLLKYTVLATGSERISTRLGPDVSASKLGVANIQVISQGNTEAKSTFVWESTDNAATPPQLSYYPRTTFAYKPVDYGTGTLAL